MTPESLPSQLHSEGGAFATVLVGELERAGLGAAFGDVDHLCYRVADVARYEAFKRAFEREATLLSEAFVNGRPIASYRLRRPIRLGDGRTVAVVELPAPKPGSLYDEGFEHIEVVTRDRLDAFVQAHAHLPLDLRNARAAVNPDVSLRLPSGLVKFHEASLEAVIAEEQAALGRAGRELVVVLDLDDTLLVTREPFLEGMRRAIGVCLARELSAAETRAGARPTFPEFFANFGIVTPDARRAALAEFQRHWPELEPRCTVPVGVRSLLSCLRSEGAVLHVWSARDDATVRSSLERFGLATLVDGVHAYDSTSEAPLGKPEPTAELAAACTGPTARTVVMIGDSRSDALGAQRLGARFLQATWVHAASLGEGVDVERRCAAPLDALAETMRLRRAARP
jgi:phosphoglycolate phosphatase-like HAD superfamily hydrolase/predicted metalloenzyme YecM